MFSCLLGSTSAEVECLHGLSADAGVQKDGSPSARFPLLGESGAHHAVAFKWKCKLSSCWACWHPGGRKQSADLHHLLLQGGNRNSTPPCPHQHQWRWGGSWSAPHWLMAGGVEAPLPSGPAETGGRGRRKWSDNYPTCTTYFHFVGAGCECRLRSPTRGCQGPQEVCLPSTVQSLPVLVCCVMSRFFSL